MRILYITGMYPTPATPQKGIFCHEQVKALKNLDIEVDVVSPIVVYDREVKCCKWEYEGVNIKFPRFFKIPGANFFYKTGDWLYQSLEHNIDMEMYDIYHADAAIPTGYAMMRASYKYGKPFVVHGHGLDVFLDNSYGKSKNVQKIVSASKAVYRNADAVCGVSEKVIDNIRKEMNEDINAYVVYNGVDVDKFFPLGIERRDFITILSVGNLIPLKGHEYTIRAVKMLQEKGYKVCLQLLGRGEQEENLRNLVNRLGLEKDVTFVGYVPYDEVVHYMQQADLFILPSYYEALGCVYLEAMACGLPVIGCRGNGIEEIISHGVNGYLVEGKNVEQIAESVESYLSNTDRNAIKACARKTVTQGYQWKHSALKLKKIYESLIEKEGFV